MAKAGRPVGSIAKEPLSCVPETMKPYSKVTALLSLRQLAEVMGISYGYIRILKSQRPEELPPHIIIGGGLIRYRATDVDAWIAAKPCAV